MFETYYVESVRCQGIENGSRWKKSSKARKPVSRRRSGFDGESCEFCRMAFFFGEDS